MLDSNVAHNVAHHVALVWVDDPRTTQYLLLLNDGYCSAIATEIDVYKFAMDFQISLTS
jgi:hypothetical protein